MANPLPTSARAPGGWLGFWVGILVTVGLVAALVQAWPEDDPRTLGSSAPVTPTTRFGVPEVPELPEGFPDLPDQTIPGVESTPGSRSTCSRRAPRRRGRGARRRRRRGAARARGSTRSYLFVTYRDPGDPSALVRRMWRNGAVDEGSPDTSAGTDLDWRACSHRPTSTSVASLRSWPTRPSHYAIPVTISHMLINRFLPFDERVLVRVYALPVEGAPPAVGATSATPATAPSSTSAADADQTSPCSMAFSSSSTVMSTARALDPRTGRPRRAARAGP